MQIVFTMARTLFSGCPCGWAVGIQLHPDSRALMIHCQDLKKIPRPRGLVSWLQSDRPDPATTQPIVCASTVCQSMPGSAPSTVSGILSQQSLPQNSDTGVPVILPRSSICVDVNHALHPHYAPVVPEGRNIGFWRICTYHGVNKWL